MAKLVAMLGNPGPLYKNTRHNTGFMFCDFINPGDSWQTKFDGLFLKKGDVVYLKPQTFMNESGVSIQKAAKFFGIKSRDILIVHDDIEQEFGSTKIQCGGGMGGHNGLRSVKQNLSTEDFWRLRIGIGRPQHGDVASFVLNRFSELEEKTLEDTFKKAQDLLEKWIEETK